MIKTPVRGMRDILPKSMCLRSYLLDLISEEAKKAGFSRIETPAIEHLDNLNSGEGGENEKLIFKILKRGEALERAKAGSESLTDSALRYDLTVPLARYFTNNSANLISPFKSFQIGSVWRADAPQKGRYRQFTQCDFDILGDNSLLAELDVIRAVLGILLKITKIANLSGLTFRLNDRRILSAMLSFSGFASEDFDRALIVLDKNDKIGLSGVKEELLNLGFEAEKVERLLSLFDSMNLENGFDLEDFNSKLGEFAPAPEVIENLQLIMASAAELSVEQSLKVKFDPTLVRGMGYYTGPIFECSLDGLNSSVAGGGRYDKMIEKFGGPSGTGACGFSIGFERLLAILEDLNFTPENSQKAVAILVGKKVSRKQYGELIAKAELLRKSGKIVSILPMARNLGRQIELLKESGFSEFEKIYGD